MKRDQIIEEMAKKESELEELRLLLCKCKWDPQDGPYEIRNHHEIVCGGTTYTYVKSNPKSDNDDATLFGLKRSNLEDAKRASIDMRIHNRLLAWRDERFPGYEHNEKTTVYFVQWDRRSGLNGLSGYKGHGHYIVGSSWANIPIGAVLFPTEESAQEVCDMLNTNTFIL